jgi:hypothetical protein
MPTPKDLLQSAISGDALGFASTLNDIMDERISNAIEERRIEIAQSIYGEPEDVLEDVEDEDISEDSEEELDDIDLDLEDLDLDEEELDDEDSEEEDEDLGDDEDDQDA